MEIEVGLETELEVADRNTEAMEAKGETALRKGVVGNETTNLRLPDFSSYSIDFSFLISFDRSSLLNDWVGGAWAEVEAEEDAEEVVEFERNIVPKKVEVEASLGGNGGELVVDSDNWFMSGGEASVGEEGGESFESNSNFEDELDRRVEPSVGA